MRIAAALLLTLASSSTFAWALDWGSHKPGGGYLPEQQENPRTVRLTEDRDWRYRGGTDSHDLEEPYRAGTVEGPSTEEQSYSRQIVPRD